MKNKTPKYLPNQVKKLLSNPNVIDVKNNSMIVFTPEFKLEAIKQFNEGITCRQIFINAGFDLSLFHHKYAQKRISEWRKTFDAKGESAFTNNVGNHVNYKMNVDLDNPDDVRYQLKMMENMLVSMQIKLDLMEAKNNQKELPFRPSKNKDGT